MPDRNYDLAGELMAAAIDQAAEAGSAVREALLDTAYRKGKMLAAEAAGPQDFLVDQGYVPGPDGNGGFTLRNCPFHRLSYGRPGVVCAMNGAFLTGAAAGCGEPEGRITGNDTPGQCCAKITASQRGRPAEEVDMHRR